MTTIAMVIGMVPIAIAKGSGAEWKNGLAWVLIGGLLSSMFLYVELPNIQMENFDNTNTNITTFAWVKKIGIALINYVDIEIGGYVIDRHYGDWINMLVLQLQYEFRNLFELDSADVAARKIGH
jgi:hypothetical protein